MASTSTSRRSSSRSRSTSRRSAAGSRTKDAIALLKEDHEKVRGLLSQLEKATDRNPDRRAQLLAKIEQEVKVHTTIEEEIFYPAFHEAGRSKEDEKLFYEAHEEHHVVDVVMPEAKQEDPGTSQFAAKAKVIKDLIEHHAEEEEKEMFPKARKLMGKERLRELGQQMAARKRSLMGEMGNGGRGNGRSRG
jgi:hemerythrin-like domain-containing protein